MRRVGDEEVVKGGVAGSDVPSSVPVLARRQEQMPDVENYLDTKSVAHVMWLYAGTAEKQNIAVPVTVKNNELWVPKQNGQDNLDWGLDKTASIRLPVRRQRCKRFPKASVGPNSSSYGPALST